MNMSTTSPPGTGAAEQLVPFTGYYTLDAGSGSFLLIDTNLLYDGGKSYEATVTISLDGISSSVYDVDSCCTFLNNTLTVTDDGGRMIAVVYLYASGSGSALSGTIQLSDTMQPTPVTGVSPFGPIELPVFAAGYYEPLLFSASPPYDASSLFAGPQLVINADYSVSYGAEGDLVPVPAYTYNYAMFVISFELNGSWNTFEMGTMKACGRVAGNSAKAGLLVSMPCEACFAALLEEEEAEAGSPP
jgi:hypothetical protein